jgi:TRAP-type C4-dicarboxylate transport system permease small subunit
VLCFVIKIVVCRELLTSRYLYICASIACVTACVFFFISLSLYSLSISSQSLFSSSESRY